jgi:hypothetical protein
VYCLILADYYMMQLLDVTYIWWDFLALKGLKYRHCVESSSMLKLIHSARVRSGFTVCTTGGYSTAAECSLWRSCRCINDVASAEPLWPPVDWPHVLVHSLCLFAVRGVERSGTDWLMGWRSISIWRLWPEVLFMKDFVSLFFWEEPAAVQSAGSKQNVLLPP